MRMFKTMLWGYFFIFFIGLASAQYASNDGPGTSLGLQSSEADVTLVRGYFESFPPPNREVREKLNIHSAADTKVYFKAHTNRVEYLAEYARKKHLQAAMEFFEVPGEIRKNPQRIEKLISQIMKGHDLKKQDDLAAEGLYRLLGVDIRGVEGKTEKEAAQNFINWLNGDDEKFAAQVLKNEDEHVKKLVLFFEKVGDLVDRRTSWEARIELSMKSAEKASELPENALKGMLKTDDMKYIEFFKKVSASVETDALLLTKNMSYQDKFKSQSAMTFSQTNCSNNVYKVLAELLAH